MYASDLALASKVQALRVEALTLRFRPRLYVTDRLPG